MSKKREKNLGGIDLKDETKCLHAGYQPKNAEPRVMPIVQSTTYVYDSTEEVAAVFDDPMKSLIYSRFGNPTVMAVEDKIAELEGGIGAMCTTSGQAQCYCHCSIFAMRGTALSAQWKFTEALSICFHIPSDGWGLSVFILIKTQRMKK